MSTPEELFDDIANNLTRHADTKRGKMFGMPCISVNGKTFAGLHKGDMTFKLGGEDRALALTIEGAALFDPGMGRPMKEWVQVPVANSKQWKGYAEEAMQYVSKMKAKK